MSNNLRDLVEYGADIEFSFNGYDYVILPWTDDGIVIGRKESEDDKNYQTYDEMINDYMLDGKLMKDVLNEIEITFTSGCK